MIDAFSHFVVTYPAPQISSKYAIQTLLICPTAISRQRSEY